MCRSVNTVKDCIRDSDRPDMVAPIFILCSWETEASGSAEFKDSLHNKLQATFSYVEGRQG